MSAKQYQITSFFQNKKQKADSIADNHEANSDVSLINSTGNEENVDPTEQSLSLASKLKQASTIIITENETKLKCHLLCCTSDTNARYVPEKQSDFKAASDKRSCQLGWFDKYKWLTYCKVVK